MEQNSDLLIKYKFLKDHYDDLKQRQYSGNGDGIHKIRNQAQIEFLELVFKNGKRTNTNDRLRELEQKFESSITECALLGEGLASLMRKARKFHEIDKKHFLYPKYLQLLRDIRIVRANVAKEIINKEPINAK